MESESVGYPKDGSPVSSSRRNTAQAHRLAAEFDPPAGKAIGTSCFAIENLALDGTSGPQVFRINDGAPASRLFVSEDGNFGMGTKLPMGRLHVTADSTGSVDSIQLVNDSGPARIALLNGAPVGGGPNNWTLNSNGTFRITGGTDGAEFKLGQDGNVTIRRELTTASSTFFPDYVLKRTTT